MEGGREGGWGRVVEVERVGGGSGEVWRVEVEGFEDETEEGGNRVVKGHGKERERKIWLVLGAVSSKTRLLSILMLRFFSTKALY